MFMTKLYPRATENRLFRADTALRKTRNNFLKASGKNFILLQLLFLGLFCWIMGSLFQQETHTKNLHVAFVDYEGLDGSIGVAVRNAYHRLQSDGFPTLVELPAAEYPTPGDLKDAVCKIRYWAALYVSPGASARLESALAGNVSFADYDPSNVLTYIWNEARYSQVVDAAVSSTLQTLSQNARVAFSNANGTGHVRSLTTPDQISVFASPWTLQSVDLQPTSQGSRAIYNTLVMILLMLQEFFYLGIINALYMNFKLYHRASPWRIIPIRMANSLLYTLIGSLCATGAIWAFRSTWNVDGGQFALTWMVLWLFAHLNFQALDVFTIWLPAGYVPHALITWIMLNVDSVLIPFELTPGFYKVGYAIPAHEVYQVLTDIWSHGCNPQLHHALPVLFSWEVVGLVLSALGVFRRCHYATVVEEQQVEAFRERVEAAVELSHARRDERVERERKERGGPEEEAADAEGATSSMAVGKVPTARTASRSVRDPEADAGDDSTESEISAVISRTDARIRREQSRASRVEYGPAFALPFSGVGDDSA